MSAVAVALAGALCCCATLVSAAGWRQRTRKRPRRSDRARARVFPSLKDRRRRSLARSLVGRSLVREAILGANGVGNTITLQYDDYVYWGPLVRVFVVWPLALSVRLVLTRHAHTRAKRRDAAPDGAGGVHADRPASRQRDGNVQRQSGFQCDFPADQSFVRLTLLSPAANGAFDVFAFEAADWTLYTAPAVMLLVGDYSTGITETRITGNYSLSSNTRIITRQWPKRGRRRRF